jgi:hypothetical protein
MKLITKSFILPAMVVFTIVLPSCKKAGIYPNDNKGSAAQKALLVGTIGNVWKLQDADPSHVWEDQFIGWVEYTNQPGVMNISDCVLNNDYFEFNADYTYTHKTYTCNRFETNFPLFRDDGGPGTWTLSSDNTLIFQDHKVFRLISVTTTDLYVADLYGTFHFKSVSGLPFPNTVQQLTGTGTKTYKIVKVKRGGVELPMTPTQMALRQTFTSGGVITNTYTDITYGAPLTGTWSFDNILGNYNFKYTNTALNQTCNLLELTETALTYSYTDSNNSFQIIYMVPL